MECNVLSLIEGGDLRSVISKCREDKSHVEEGVVWKVLAQLLLALQECHKKRDGVHKVDTSSVVYMYTLNQIMWCQKPNVQPCTAVSDL